MAIAGGWIAPSLIGRTERWFGRRRRVVPIDAFQQKRSISCLEKFLEYKLIAGVHGRGKSAWIDACGDKMRSDEDDEVSAGRT